MWINPSQFWKGCKMRKQLLSILLRAGSKYDPDKDNYEEALYTQEYIKGTKSAVMRFLFGFTEYTQNVCGWERAFRAKTDSEIRKLLVCPDFKKLNDCLIAGVIWN